LAARVLHEVRLICSWGFPRSWTLHYHGYLDILTANLPLTSLILCADL
jgi:hypothetical protein